VTVRPRRLAHRGSVVAIGFAIDPGLTGLAEARRRVLALWTPGATVTEADGLLAITGLRAVRVRADAAPGAPIVEQAGLASAVPLEADEAAALAADAPPRAVIVARAGAAAFVAAGAGVDIGAWIDLDAAELVAVEPLAAPPAVATVAVAAPVDTRAVLGIAAAEGAPELRAAIVDALTVPAPAPAVAPSRWSRLLRWLASRAAPRGGEGGPRRPVRVRRASWWTRLRRRLPRAPARNALPAGPAPVDDAPPPPSWRDRLRDRILRALWQSRLGRELGRRHAEYLRRMLELFDRGDLDAALRHAIPLGGGGGEPGGLSSSVPRPRDDIRLPMTASAGRRSQIPVSEEGTEMIRRRYRAALARLEQLGRIEEAAFVLAELLGDVPGAIALLERHRQFALAARLAEGRKLDPGLIVRLWFLAGDRERAILAARRHRAWADAIARLQHGHAREAAALRLLWADSLADAGDYAQAVEVAWPVAEARRLALAWIDRGIAGGGSASARLLVRKLAALPETFSAVAPSLLAILDDPDDDAVWRRVALVDTLVGSPPSPELRTIGRAAVRAVIADLGRGADGDAPTLLPRLMRFADDAALRADQPVIPPGQRPTPLVDRGAPFARRWAASDAGVIPVHDAAMLPGGRMLIALGELGVRLLGRDGRTVHHFDQPATRLIVSDHGTRALVAVPRGGARRIARLDLVDRRGAYWCDAEVDHAVATYDGSAWMVTRGKDLLAIDTTAARWTAVWGVTTDAVCGEVRRDGDLVAALVGGAEVWCYEVLTLRRRRMVEPFEDASHPATQVLVRAPRPVAQDWVDLRVPVTGDGLERRFVLAPFLSGAGWMLPIGPGAPMGLEVEGRFAAAAVRAEHGAAVIVAYLSMPAPVVIARLELDGAAAVHLRIADLVLTAADDRGRVIAFDVRAGTVRRDLRIAP
jgi:hypothetical protein